MGAVWPVWNINTNRANNEYGRKKCMHNNECNEEWKLINVGGDKSETYSLTYAYESIGFCYIQSCYNT